MPNYKFEVDTQRLTNSAGKIEEYKETYESNYKKMYSEVEQMRIRWKGTSSDSFNAALEEARSDYEGLTSALTEYIDKLRRIAKNYETTESSITTSANSLR